LLTIAEARRRPLKTATFPVFLLALIRLCAEFAALLLIMRFPELSSVWISFLQRPLKAGWAPGKAGWKLGWKAGAGTGKLGCGLKPGVNAGRKLGWNAGAGAGNPEEEEDEEWEDDEWPQAWPEAAE